jgi:dolichyl-phosphate beta-glucosyltransferase
VARLSVLSNVPAVDRQRTGRYRLAFEVGALDAIIHLSFLIPAHNEALLLEQNVCRLVDRLRAVGPATILLVENGSTDATWAVAQRLCGTYGRVTVGACREDQPGLGRAYDRALRELEARPSPGCSHWVVLSAADLPFGFTDLDRALPLMSHPDAPPVLLGSKGHPESRIDVSPKRRAASLAYRLLRRGLLGMRVRDCQGTLFLRAEVAFRLRPFIRSRDYFYTTELVYLVERLGIGWRELPVELAPDERKSTVRLLRDSLNMGLQLLALSRRARRGDPGLPTSHAWTDGQGVSRFGP